MNPDPKLESAVPPSSTQNPDPGSHDSKNRASERREKIFADYELIERIACGGMGVVYKARHIPLHRLVALKMIAAGQLASPSAVERFRNETEAAAQLDHPNIVPIYEVGEHDGVHFFTMKLVEGPNLAQWSAECRVRDVKWCREAASVVTTIARAVHYAHQRGILHRDLKPANILLDKQGHPHVTDFGLAKLLSAEGSLTRSMATIGTPGYMSPEQAAGEARHVTTATDLYGLGAILYELLTGRAPFQGESEMQILRRVLEEEPLEPRLVNPCVDRDLQTICLKCLAREPQKRYGTAENLAEDLEHWSAGEPIRARPASTVEKVTRWCRRKPAIATLAAATVLTALVGFAAVTWQWRQSRASENTAIREAAKSRQVADLLERMWQSVGPSVALGQDTKLLQSLLQTAAQSLSGSLSNQPEVEAEMRLTIGQVYLDLADYPQAESMFRSVVRLSKRSGNPDRLSAQASSLLGRVLCRRGQQPEAEIIQREALESWRQMSPKNWPEIAFCLNELGCILQMRSQLGEAEGCYTNALEIRRRVFGENHPSVAESLNGMATLRTAQGRWTEAEQYHRRTLAVYEKIPGDHRLQRAVTYTALAQMFLATRNTDQAERAARESVAIRREVLGDQHPVFADSLGVLAGVFADQDNLSAAEELARQALAIYKKQGNQAPGVTTSLKMLVDILLRKRDAQSAEALFQDFLSSGSLGGPGTAGILQARGSLRARLWRWKDAANDFRAAIQLDPSNHEYYHALAPLLFRNGDFDEYCKICDTIRARFGTIKNDANIAGRVVRDCLLGNCAGSDRIVEGLWADTAVALDPTGCGRRWGELCKGWTELRRGQNAEAIKWTKQALDELGERPNRDVSAYMILAMADLRLNESKEARIAFNKGLDIADHQLPKLEDGCLDTRWIDWLMAQSLISEARVLLEDDPENELAQLPPGSAGNGHARPASSSKRRLAIQRDR